MKTLHLRAISVVLALSLSSVAYGQQPASVNLNEPYGVIFDDFMYSTKLDPLKDIRSQPNGSLLGVSRWMIGSPSGNTHIDSTRAWYSYLWPEFGSWMDSYNYSGFHDRSVFDVGGSHMSVDTSGSGRLVMRLNAGEYNNNHWRSGGSDFYGGIGMYLTSGFDFTNGVWLIRMKLPERIGTTYNGGPANILYHTGFYLQGSEWSKEDRPAYQPIQGVPRSWSEVNMEFNNFNSNQSEMSYSSTGVSWAKAFSNTPNPGFSGCYVLDDDDAPAGGTVIMSMVDCQEYLFNETGSMQDTYMYLMIRISNGDVKYHIYILDEEEDGSILGYRNGIDSTYQRRRSRLGFDMFSMETPVIESGIKNHYMRSMIHLSNPNPIRDNTVRRPITLNNSMELKVDWFLYSPDTNKEIWDMINLSTGVRLALRNANKNVPKQNQIHRISTMGDIEEYYSRLSYPYSYPGSDICYGFGITPRSGRFEINESPSAALSGMITRSVGLEKSNMIYDTRHMSYKVEWYWMYRLLKSYGYMYVSNMLSNNGYNMDHYPDGQGGYLFAKVTPSVGASWSACPSSYDMQPVYISVGGYRSSLPPQTWEDLYLYNREGLGVDVPSAIAGRDRWVSVRTEGEYVVYDVLGRVRFRGRAPVERQPLDLEPGLYFVRAEGVEQTYKMFLR